MAYLINQDNYFSKTQPAKSEELLNTILVNHHPQQLQDFNDEYYRSMEPIVVPFGSTVDIECKYSDPPCIDPVATAYETGSEGELTYDDTTGKIDNSLITINSVTYYAWGAIVNVTNNNSIPTTTTTSTTITPVSTYGYCVVVIAATPLKSQGKEGYTAEYTASILENGVLKYSYPDNYLIQHRLTSIEIATTLLATYVIPRKDISTNWRGDPSLELTDIVDIPEYDKHGIYTLGSFIIYRQVIEYDGTIKSKLDGRKTDRTAPAPTTSTTTGAP